MKIVTYNIQYATGRDGALDLQRIAAALEGADVIALQEVDRHWPRSGNVDQAKALGEMLRGYYWVYGGGVDLHCDAPAESHAGGSHAVESHAGESNAAESHAGESHAAESHAAESHADSSDNESHAIFAANKTHAVKTPAARNPRPNLRRQFGNMILSRQPLLTSRHHLLPKYGSAGAPASIQRSALEATAQFASGALRFYSVHLTHLSAATRLPQVKALCKMHARAESEGAPVDGGGGEWEISGAQPVAREALLLGDFNFTPDSREYELLAGPRSDYGGRISNPRGFVDAWHAAGRDAAAGFTSDVGGVPARLDYCFASTALRARITDCYIDDRAQGSDHYPLWVELDW